jgi:hypothetical protein
MKDRDGLSLDAVDDFRQAIDGPFSRIWLPDSSVGRPRPHLKQPRAKLEIDMPQRGYSTPTQRTTLRWLELAPAKLVTRMRIGAGDRLPIPIADAVRAPCRSVQHMQPPRSDNRRPSRPKCDAEPGG